MSISAVSGRDALGRDLAGRLEPYFQHLGDAEIPSPFMGDCGAEAVHQFLMQELDAFFAAPFGRFKGLVFTLFLQFLEGPVDQRPEQQAGDVEPFDFANFSNVFRKPSMRVF